MRRSSAIVLGLVVALLPHTAHAVVSSGLINTCVVSGISCLGSDLSGYIYAHIISPAKDVAIIGILIASLVFFALRLIISSDNESTITESKKAYIYAFAGTILVLGASLIADSFTTKGAVETGPLETLIADVVLFIKGILVAALLANTVYQGALMILAVDDSQIDKARTKWLHGLYGTAVVLLAAPIINTFAPAGGNIGEGIAETVGIANFVITIFGLLAVVGIIVGGILLVISITDEYKERAHKLIIACLVALAVVISAAALINLFLF
ncbi:MAG: hypothetical protein PHI23_01195 [Candidatus Peribacteraceae bacterium]|nr:hypothetical protein [Candidatus Peribacteraceae bacterium]